MTLAELRAIDEARTPGPWAWSGDSPDGVEPHVCPHGGDWEDHGPDLRTPSTFVITSHGYDASSLSISLADAAAITTHANTYPLLLAIAEAATELVDSARPDGLGLGSFGRLTDALDALEETT